MSDTTSAVHLEYLFLSIPLSVVLVLLSKPLNTRAVSLIRKSFPVTSTPSTLASNVAASSMAEVIATRQSLHIHRNKNHYIIHLLIAVVNFHNFHIPIISMSMHCPSLLFSLHSALHSCFPTPCLHKMPQRSSKTPSTNASNKLAPKHMQL